MPVTLRFHPDAREHVRAIREVERATSGFWSSPWATVAIGLAPIVVGLLSGDDLLTSVGRWWWFVVGAPLLFLLLLPYLQLRRVRQFFRDTPSAAGEHVYTLDERGLRAATASGASELAWDAVVRTVETREFVLVFFSKKVAYPLPKRAVAGPAELRALRELFRDRLGNRFVAAESLDAPRSS